MLNLRCKRRCNGEQHRIDAALDRAVYVARSHLRDDRVADDLAGLCVRKRAFQSVSDFDANFTIAHEYEENCAVVDAFSPNLPLLRRANRPILERRISRRLPDPDDDVMLSRLFVRL